MAVLLGRGRAAQAWGLISPFDVRNGRKFGRGATSAPVPSSRRRISSLDRFETPEILPRTYRVARAAVPFEPSPPAGGPADLVDEQVGLAGRFRDAVALAEPQGE